MRRRRAGGGRLSHAGTARVRRARVRRCPRDAEVLGLGTRFVWGRGTRGPEGLRRCPYKRLQADPQHGFPLPTAAKRPGALPPSL